MESLLPTRPGTYRELISRSLYLYRRSFSTVFFYSLLLGMIVFTPRLMSDLAGRDIFATLELFSSNHFWLILINISGLIFFIALLWHMFCVMRAKHEPFIEDFVVGAKKVFYVIIASTLQSVIVTAFAAMIYGVLYLLSHLDLLFTNTLWGVFFTTIIFFAQFFLLLYVSTLFVFLVPLIAIENEGIISAIKKSASLVWNHWWRVFSTQLTPWIFYMLLLGGLKYILHVDIHIYFTDKVSSAYWATLINVVAFTVYAPWVASLLLTQLKDLELRKQLAAPKNRSKRK